MKWKDWICTRCEALMISTQNGHMVCPRLECHARMRRLWGVKDLPVAKRVDYKRFRIADCEGYWEYVPHAHAGCMSNPPEPGTIVAKVRRGCNSDNGGPSWQPMTFRQAKPPRGEK